MNIENAKQALEWFGELPDDRHDQKWYFSHCGLGYDGVVPPSATMCFGGMIIHRAKLDIEKPARISGSESWGRYLVTVAKWLDISYEDADYITQSMSREECVSRMHEYMK